MPLQHTQRRRQGLWPLFAQQDAGRSGCEKVLGLFYEASAVRIVHQHGQARLGAELANTQGAGTEDLAGHRLAAFGQRSGKDEHRVKAGHLQVDRPAGSVCCLLQTQAGGAAAGEGRRADQRQA